MRIVIGIDIGGTNTKIVGIRDGQIFSPVQIRATDPIASFYGAFGKFVSTNNIELSSIERVLVTGVGAQAITGRILGVPTARVDEFMAVGMGGLYLAGIDKAVVASMGTGTAFVAADKTQARHLGGTGVGGGTLYGLSKSMLGMTNIDDVIDFAKEGDLSKIDIMVSEITKAKIKTLSPDATAANFAKMDDLATKNDIALGIINMICQTVGMLSVFAARETGDDKIILTGYLSRLPQARELFDAIERLSTVKFIIPEYSEFATAIGAAITYLNSNNYTEL